ncbi:hypothetical protein AOC36_04620 [Erysipelothrix larvae]|uniref:Inosine/uridine-preferring nucleoside hydrolase domain-containing protein n=1 Tax=Erysipelothrix larvae TaxID=1514105 RepID=A0A0X8GZG1_9FIRM|nr:nucleoside hydrolase [Erysipelothrix larvae]AMC93280.1 hypothetical protein AOC36_04620 [Erysipelothrix larvae]
MNKIPLIIDCDPGIDDAFALFYAIGCSQFDIKLITTVSGNVSVEKTTANALEILRLADESIDVAKGANRPLFSKPLYAEAVHGVSGLGDYAYKPCASPSFIEKDAVDAMIDVLETTSDKITIVALGPLTNIATLLIRYPKAKEKIERISIMGGGLKGGNANIAAEFNIFVDPEAASIVFDSGILMTMAGLDVTEQSYILTKHIHEIGTFGTVGAMLKEMLGDTTRCNLHDVVAVMTLVHPDIFSGTNHRVVVETGGVYSRGLTLADDRYVGRSTQENVYVLRDVNLEAFQNELKKGLQVYQ